MQYNDLKELDAIGFDESDKIFEDGDLRLYKNKLSIAGNRLEALSPQLSCLARDVQRLDLSNNCLKVIDESILESFVHLEALKMLNSIQPDIKLTLGFLASLVNLKVLSMTLPDIVVDFGIFESLAQLEELELRSVFSLDVTKKRPSLTKKDFDHLSGLNDLRSLALTHFELNSIDEDTLKDFTELTHIELSNNEIAQIHENAFKRRPSFLVSINIASNKLKELNPSWFEGIARLRVLNASNNNISSENIGRLRSAFFKKLGGQVIVIA